MNWRTLLAKIGLCEPPVPDLVREASDRTGTVNRRAFLQLAGAAVAGLAIDPERLLWMPGEHTILLPSELEPHDFETVEWVTREVLRLLQNNLKLLHQMNRPYDEMFARLGDTVPVRTPVRFGGPMVPPVRPVTLTDQFNVSIDALSPPKVKRDLPRIAAALAERVRDKGLNVFGTLNLPQGVHEAAVATDRATGLSVRGLRAVDISDPNGPVSKLRFDVLGGRA